MSAYGVLRNTIFIVVPVSVVVCLVTLGIGYRELAMGFLFGVTGGIAKSYVMLYSAIHDTNRLLSFALRFLIIGVAFVLGILVSIHAFFAAVAGIFFVHIVFIMDQVRASNIGELR